MAMPRPSGNRAVTFPLSAGPVSPIRAMGTPGPSSSTSTLVTLAPAAYSNWRVSSSAVLAFASASRMVPAFSSSGFRRSKIAEIRMPSGPGSQIHPPSHNYH